MRAVFQSGIIAIIGGAAISSLMVSARKDVIRPSVVGGVAASAKEFPSFVWLDNCGGTLVHADMVLTGAQCSNGLGKKAKIGGIKSDGSDSEMIEIIRKIRHPLYAPGPLFLNDIMLVQLRSASNATITPLNENPSIPKENETVTAIGFGYTSPNGAVSAVLNQVDVKVVSQDTCQLNRTKTKIRDQHICTEGGIKGVCVGDGGGPLYYRNGNITQQVAIMSFVSSDCKSRPPVFTRVSTFENFIKRTICTFSTYKPAWKECLLP